MKYYFQEIEKNNLNPNLFAQIVNKITHEIWICDATQNSVWYTMLRRRAISTLIGHKNWIDHRMHCDDVL